MPGGRKKEGGDLRGSVWSVLCGWRWVMHAHMYTWCSDENVWVDQRHRCHMEAMDHDEPHWLGEIQHNTLSTGLTHRQTKRQQYSDLICSHIHYDDQL
jgi:hypothetical protein